MNQIAISFRVVGDDDKEFLYEVYASTREEELQWVDWSPEQKEQFLRMQFAAQDFHYRTHYMGAEFLAILVDQTPVGRLYLQRNSTELRIAK